MSSSDEPGAADASPGAARRLLVIGDTQVARRVCATLSELERHTVTHLVAPGDAELTQALQEPHCAAAVLIRDDVAALRYALALAHLAPALAITVTVFDRTIATQLRSFLPQATVVSPASIAVPSLAGPCLASGVLASFTEGPVRVEVRRATQGRLGETRVEVPRATIASRGVKALRLNPRHHDQGTRLMLVGLLGLLVLFLVDWSWLVFGEGHSANEAFLDAARVVATVGPGATDVSTTYGIFSGIAMLLTIVLTALFTAGLVDRLLEPRLLRLVGPRTAPRRGHVVVVGLGQVGARLCAELVSQGVPVVGVDRDRHAVGVRLAGRLRIPVVIGDGSERSLLEKVRLPHCRALAAVGSDDLDNIAVAVAASAVSPQTRVILRAGEQEAIAETRSLLPLGVVRDVTRMGASLVTATMLGRQADAVVNDGDRVYLRTPTGEYEPTVLSRREDCPHPVG